MAIAVTAFREDLFLLRETQVGVEHHFHQSTNVDLRLPAQHASRLGRVALEVIHFGWTEVAGIDLHMTLPVELQLSESQVQEIADRDSLAGRHYVRSEERRVGKECRVG